MIKKDKFDQRSLSDDRYWASFDKPSKQYLVYLHRLGYGYLPHSVSEDLMMDINADKSDDIILSFVNLWEQKFMKKLKELEPLTFEEYIRDLKINEILKNG